MKLKEVIEKFTDANFEKLARLIDSELKLKSKNVTMFKDMFKDEELFGMIKNEIYKMYWNIQHKFGSSKIEIRSDYLVLFKNASVINKYYFLVYDKEKNLESIEIAFLDALVDFCNNWNIGSII